jgi:pSer/pThr/pTyr-binding forkhead associated (FHA) protein
VDASPVGIHQASPEELRERIAAEREGVPFLVLRDEAGKQRIVGLKPGAPTTLGRSPECDISLEWDQEVSRLHAELQMIGDQWVLVDDGLSSNGTFLGDERISGRRRLADGDVFRVGATTIAFRHPLARGSGTTRAQQPATAVSVTPAQRRVLIALCRPFRDSTYSTPATNQQIADELVVSVDAVKSNLRALFSTFGVDDLPQNQKRASLALRALRTGVVSRRDL